MWYLSAFSNQSKSIARELVYLSACSADKDYWFGSLREPNKCVWLGYPPKICTFTTTHSIKPRGFSSLNVSFY